MFPRKNFINLKFSSQQLNDVYLIKKSKEAIIGKGNFGVIVPAKDKLTGQIRAVKIISKEELLKKDPSLGILENEFNIMLTLDHPNVVRLYEAYQDPKYVYLVIEHMKGKNLFETLLNENFQMTETNIRDIFFQIIKGLQYLHKNGIVHRDIKPENIMFVNQNSNKIKIIDFGVSKYFYSHSHENKQVTLRTQTGSLYFMAPEIMDGKYDYYCDIWSAGVVLYSLLTGIPPFWDMDPQKVLKKIKNIQYDFNHEIFKKISPLVVDLIKRMLVPRDGRLTTDQILEHKWMKIELNNKTFTNTAAMLKKFYVGKTLSKIILKIITANSSETDNIKLGELFVKIDDDGDGLISREALIEGIQYYYEIYDKELFDFILKEYASGQNITYNSFLTAMNSCQNYSNFEERVEKAFYMIDVKKDGKITSEDIKNAFEKLDVYKIEEAKDWDDLVEENDKEKKGYLTMEDFKKIMMFYASE